MKSILAVTVVSSSYYTHSIHIMFSLRRIENELPEENRGKPLHPVTPNFIPYLWENYEPQDSEMLVRL